MTAPGTAIVLAGCLACLPLVAAAYRNEPPPAHTGGFGEPTCHQCHFDANLNEPGGSLEVRGFPETYEPDRTYMLEIVVTGPRLRTAGFQLAIRYLAGARAGTSAARPKACPRRGTLAATGEICSYGTLACSRQASSPPPLR